MTEKFNDLVTPELAEQNSIESAAIELFEDEDLLLFPEPIKLDDGLTVVAHYSPEITDLEYSQRFGLTVIDSDQIDSVEYSFSATTNLNFAAVSKGAPSTIIDLAVEKSAETGTTTSPATVSDIEAFNSVIRAASAKVRESKQLT
ncbi:MAG: hypothetical protein JWO69_1964 [Thermoleophilia bacterium]|nr:hypothetical protein [Thermoleophilia bacterium]